LTFTFSLLRGIGNIQLLFSYSWSHFDSIAKLCWVQRNFRICHFPEFRMGSEAITLSSHSQDSLGVLCLMPLTPSCPLVVLLLLHQSESTCWVLKRVEESISDWSQYSSVTQAYILCPQPFKA
jgi:hypothetical protein